MSRYSIIQLYQILYINQLIERYTRAFQSMNFNKILQQLNHVEIQNRKIDHKFMSTHTFEKKYKQKDLHLQKTPDFIQFSRQDNQQYKGLLYQAKHRYFQEIQQDEIEDANIFGYSTFQYFTYFKKNQAKMNHLSKRQQKDNKKHKSRSKLTNTQNNNSLTLHAPEQTGSLIRPKTAIITRGTSTKRRVHHKLSLNQVERAAISQNLMPLNMKQQYFTEDIFDFKQSNNKDPKVQNIRCGSRTGTFYKQCRPQSFHLQVKQKKSQYYFQNQNDKPPKRHLIFQQTQTKFYQHKNPTNLIKSKQKHLDVKKINQQKTKFTQGVSQHFDNLTKKVQSSTGISGMTKSCGLKSVVYERQSNNRRINQQLAHYTKSINQKVLNPRSSSPNLSNIAIINAQNQPLTKPQQFIHNYIIKESSPQQSQLITQVQDLQPQFLRQLKTFSDISVFHSINSLLLQKSELPDLQFKYDNHYTPLHYAIFDQRIIQNMNNHCTEVSDFRLKSIQHFNPKSFSKLPKQKSKIYTFFIVHCMSLEWIKFDNVELKDETFVYKENNLNLLQIAEKMMRNNLPSDFVHVMITRKTIAQKSLTQNEDVLVFQTFVHNSDIKYFEGRQIQIQYFKYFLKRFITFDSSILKKDQIESSISLILESEVKTPTEFEEFCKQMKIKDNLNIIALRNLDSKSENITFKSIEISLSKLLIDANETVMMVKKELFEGYDWRGVSLTKGTKQHRGYIWSIFLFEI